MFGNQKTAVHEMGHSLGMLHDFVRSEPDYPCRSTPTEVCCNGFMNYGDHPNAWSDCSIRDFRKAYNDMNWQDDCMDVLHDTSYTEPLRVILGYCIILISTYNVSYRLHK